MKNVENDLQIGIIFRLINKTNDVKERDRIEKILSRPIYLQLLTFYQPMMEALRETNHYPIIKSMLL
jgi:hypothetical protein